MLISQFERSGPQVVGVEVIEVGMLSSEMHSYCLRSLSWPCARAPDCTIDFRRTRLADAVVPQAREDMGRLERPRGWTSRGSRLGPPERS